jgi:hypothetical protein
MYGVYLTTYAFGTKLREMSKEEAGLLDLNVHILANAF